MVDIFAQEKIEVEAPKTSIPRVSTKELNAPAAMAPALPPKLSTQDLAPVQAAAQDIFESEEINIPTIGERNQNALNNVVKLDNPVGEKEVAVAESVNHDREQTLALAKTRFTPDQIAEFTNNPIGFADAFDFLDANKTLPGGGIYEAIDAVELKGIGEKLEKGEELSVGEDTLLNKFIDQSVEKNLRGFSIGGSIAYYGAQIPAFAVEFAATGGIGKVAQKATLKAAEKVALKGVTAKVIGATANVAARSAAMPLQYTPTYAERRLNDYAAITDKGDLVRVESKETPTVSALKAFGYTSAEVASEMSGGIIGKYTIEPLTKALKTPIVSAANRLPVAFREAVYNAYKTIKPNAQVSKVFSVAGWNGMIQELGEERVSDVLRATVDASTDKNYTMDDFIAAVSPSKDQLLVEAGLVSIMGGIHTAGDITFNLMKSKGVPAPQAVEAVKNMSAIEKEQFVQDNLPMPKSDYPTNAPSQTQNMVIKGEIPTENSVLPPELTLVSMKDLNVDAERFQFKSGTDANGVMDTLKGVKKWEPSLAEPLLLWQANDGRLFVADGHQRTGLAKRLMADDPNLNIQNYAQILKESDGVTPEFARAWAAGLNVAKGTGTAIDAAKVLRTSPEMLPALPPKSALVKTAEGLAALNDDVFRMAVNERLDERFAAAIGRLEADSAKQSALAEVLIKSEPENVFQAEQIIRQAQDVGFNKSQQTNLFGTFESQESLFKERAKVLDKGIKALKLNTKALKAIGSNEKFIESLGNVIAKDQNQAALNQSAVIVKTVETLANRKGAVSDALNEAAKYAKDTGKYTEAAKRFAADVQSLIEQGLLNGDVERARDDIYEREKQSGADDQGQLFDISPDDFDAPLAAEDGGSAPVMVEGDIAEAQVEAAQKAEPPPILDEESSFNRYYREWIDELDPIKKLSPMATARGAEIKPGRDPKLLSTTYAGILGSVRQNLQVETFYRDAEGNNILTGKSLKATLDDFDNMFLEIEPKRRAREMDFQDYLVAQRYLKDLDPRDDVEVTVEQRLKSVADMTRLAAKYGDNFRFFETFAQEIYDFQRRILENLVRSGIMEQDKFDKILATNPNYIPFDRVIEKSYVDAISSSGVFTDAKASRVVKRIFGSDKEVKNVFQSIIKNTAKIIDLAARNDVAKSITDLSGYLDEYIQYVPTPIVKVGKADFKISYDPKLRDMLTQTIEKLGNTFERAQSIKVKGFRGVLGSYSPMEKVVRLKIGANEGTLAHEVGHMLDYKYGLKERLLSDPKIKTELQTLAEGRLYGDISMVYGEEGLKFKENIDNVGSAKYRKYIKNDREILANMFDAYVNSPEQLAEIAPNAKAAFDKFIDEKPDRAFLKDIKASTARAEEVIQKDAYGEGTQPLGTMVVYKDGKKSYYRVAKPLLEAVNQLSPSRLNFLQTMFTVPASVLRAGATLVPEFWVRNVLRDQHDSFLQSGVKNTPVDFVKGLFAVIGKTDLYSQWEKSGGTFNSYMDLSDNGMERAYQELFRPDGRMMRYLKNPIRIAEDLSQTFEQATRVGIYGKAKDLGQSDVEAAVTSREATLDFARHGSVGKRVNQIIPFFNAGVQGSNKMIRTFRKNPKALTMWAVATVTLPSVMIAGYYLYGASDDDRQEYLEIPQWQKDMFWVVKVGDEWKRYPKPFSYGYIFGSMPERVMTWMYKGNKPEGENIYKSLAMGIAGSFSPINDPSAIIPPLAKMAIEDVTNYNFFTGRNIYPSWMERLEPEERANKYTSETAKALGKEIGVSPAIIDNTVRGTLAGTGQYVMDAGDMILKATREWNGEKVGEEPLTPADVPIIKAFAVRDPGGYNSNSAANFFKNYEEVQQKKATLGKFKGEERKIYQQENRDIIAQYKPMKAFYTQMRGIQKQIDVIYDDKEMKSAEKVKRIKTLNDNITKIARRANVYYSKTQEKK